jgi:hypothetical protein
MADKSSINAFTEGYEAFLKGNLICPYRPMRMFSREWHRGFNTAYFDNLKKIRAA